MKKRRKKKASVRLQLKHWLWIGVALVVAACAGGAAMWYYMQCRVPYKGDGDVRIFIPFNATNESVSDTLRARLGDEYADQVLRLWGWRGGKAQRAAGSYVVRPGMTAKTLSDKLCSGNQDPVRVTFNNIRTISQLAKKVAGQMEFDAMAFEEACDSVLPKRGYDRDTYAAAFFPDTYEFYWNADPKAVVDKLADYSDRWWTDERVAKAEREGLTPLQVYILGSIVDEETAKKDEKPKVARLYINRLHKGMRLQADPTVKFAIGDFALRRITNEHLKVDSPYNTYLHEGLPPGPIRIVPSSTLEAVLDAPQHDYIYMCAKEDFSGYHNFAVTGAEHAANARRYHDELNRRKIK